MSEVQNTPLAAAIKVALCVRTAEVNADYSNIPELETFLMDRVICETDTSYLQVIPYLTLVSKIDGRILQYTRGGGGGEGRLFNKTSIGMGGHMDVRHSGSFYYGIAVEAARELCEELGIPFTPELVERISALLYEGRFEFFHLKDSDNPVDHVHLAVSIVLPIDPQECTTLEEGAIVDPVWRTLDELYAEVKSGNTRLELWSQRVVRNIVSQLQSQVS